MDKDLVFQINQYILLPVSYNSSGEVSIDTAFIEKAKNQKGNPRLVLRAYYNPHFLGSPVFRRVDEKNPRGLRVFIPEMSTDWTVVQLKSISEKAAYGKPVNLEKGLIISYALKCRELYSKALTYIPKDATIKVQDLKLPSFEKWMENKEGYISMYERAKKENSEVIIKGLKLQIKSLKDRISKLNDKHCKHLEHIKIKTRVLKSDLEALEVTDEEVYNDIKAILEIIEEE